MARPRSASQATQSSRGLLGWLAWLGQRLLAGIGALVLTLAVFLVLPLMQTISTPPERDWIVRNAGVYEPPPPPPPPAEEEPEPEDPPEEPPQLAQEAEPLDLSQLELALNPGAGDALFGDISASLVGQILEQEEGDDTQKIFSMAELDRRPQVIFQRPPRYPADLRSRRGTVTVLFTVNEQGRVIDPEVVKSTEPAFNRLAVEAVSRWRFEPGTRNGEPVQFRMRIPITFDAG